MSLFQKLFDFPSKTKLPKLWLTNKNSSFGQLENLQRLGSVSEVFPWMKNKENILTSYIIFLLYKCRINS